MKTISGGLNTHINSPVTTLARFWHIVRVDGTEFFFTSHDQDLTISAFSGHNGTYVSSAGFSASAIANNSDLSVDNLDIAGVFDDVSITNHDLRSGLFDYADIYIFYANWQDLTQGPLKMRRGKLGEVVASPQGWFTVELRGMTQLLQQKVLELYGPECRADLGDSRCKVPLDPALRQNTTAYAVGDYIKVSTSPGSAPYYTQFENRIYKCTTAGTTAGSAPSYDTTVGNTTSDGSAVFTTFEAWTRSAVVATATDQTHFTITVTEARAVNGWFDYGVMTWESGNNSGRSTEIKKWTASGAHVQIYISAGFPIQVGDKLRLSPGCNKSLAACRDKFANLDNMRAESYLPGNDKAFFYPDAT